LSQVRCWCARRVMQKTKWKQI